MNWRLKSMCGVVFVVMMWCSQGWGQTIHRLEQINPNSVTTHVGVDDTLLAVSLGYDRLFKQHESFRADAYTTLTLPVVSLVSGDFRFRLGVRGMLFLYDAWAISLDSSVVIRRGKNPVMTAWGVGIDPTIAPGYYGRKWTFALSWTYDVNLLTHIEHSDLYRDFYYDDAKDCLLYTSPSPRD